MFKKKILNLLRKFQLMYFIDWIRYYVMLFKNRKINNEFKSKNPSIKLPPNYLMYESFQINYKKYYTDSIDSANWVTNHLKKHIDLTDKRILDWGCGPGRIIRHLPNIIGNGCEFYGTDYNKKSIEWCAKNIPNIDFNINTLEAKLPYSDNFFDVIYGISIFTHLSEKMHYDWYKELYRILKPNGVLFLTTQGDNFIIKLTSQELEKYNENQLVIRKSIKEGHRTFSAFHPKEFMIKLFSNAEILEHVVSSPKNKSWIPQDIWIIKKQ